MSADEAYSLDDPSRRIRAALDTIQSERAAHPEMSDADAALLLVSRVLAEHPVNRSDFLFACDEVTVSKSDVSRVIEDLLATRAIRRWHGLLVWKREPEVNSLDTPPVPLGAGLPRTSRRTPVT